MTNPYDDSVRPTADYVNLGLPPDTISVKATAATFLLTASGDSKLVPQLALNTEEMGWYRIYLKPDVFKSLTLQNDYFSHLTNEDTHAIARQLHEDSQ